MSYSTRRNSNPSSRPRPSTPRSTGSSSSSQGQSRGRSQHGPRPGQPRERYVSARTDVVTGPSPSTPTLKVISLGGVGDMGKNMTVLEYGSDILVIDCGNTFPDETMPGIDLVIPDVTYLEQNRSKIRGIVITHGHEDHIGSIPYIVPKLGVPVYAPPLASALIKVGLEEFPEGKSVKIINYQPDEHLRLGVFDVSFFRVNHSIPDTFGIIINTPEGYVVNTGDFKFDATPFDGLSADYDKLRALSKEKPLLLMSESTNAHRPGHSPSEMIIAASFDEVFSKAKGRIIVASFASRIDRMQHVVNSAMKYNRKLAIAGRSMLKYFKAASDLGYIKYPRDILVDLNNVKNLLDYQVVILSTGSQGQQGSALQRMAMGEHRQVKIKESDTVVLSSSPIPGNERSVYAIINNLLRMNSHVIFDQKMQIHVSGHGYSDDMREMIDLVKPKYFMPIHGDYHMLVAHKEIAQEMGIPTENIFIAEDGEVLEFKKGVAKKLAKKIFAGSVLVDGLGIGDVKEIVLRDRQTMAAEGMIILIAVVDKQGRLASSPDIISRGFVYMREKGDLINKVREHVKKTFDKHVSKVPDDWGNIKNKLRETIGDYLYKETERRPLILPVIIEV